MFYNIDNLIKDIIPRNEWGVFISEMPQKCKDFIKIHNPDRWNLEIGHSKEYGWFAISEQDQGFVLIWAEK